MFQIIHLKIGDVQGSPALTCKITIHIHQTFQGKRGVGAIRNVILRYRSKLNLQQMRMFKLNLKPTFTLSPCAGLKDQSMVLPAYPILFYCFHAVVVRRTAVVSYFDLRDFL